MRTITTLHIIKAESYERGWWIDNYRRHLVNIYHRHFSTSNQLVQWLRYTWLV